MNDNLDEGVWFQSYVSGLWYRSHEAAGSVRVVRIDGQNYYQAGGVAWEGNYLMAGKREVAYLWDIIDPRFIESDEEGRRSAEEALGLPESPEM